MDSQKPNVFITIRPELYHDLFSPEADARLREMANVSGNSEDSNYSSDELAGLLSGVDILITGWGSPPFTDAVLAAAGQLKLVAHSAGSIKRMLPEAVFEQGITVTHSAGAIAPAVADMTLLSIMLCLRHVHEMDRDLKAGKPWGPIKAAAMGEEIVGQRIGVVGAGYTGQQVITLLKALQVDLWVYDPYLTQERAGELGIRKVELDELLSECQIVTLQAPPTEETYHMIGARELSLLQDGCVFVNTARSHLVDQDALLAELQTGRFRAALDVFDEEPLPEDSPFRSLENVIITPHIAAATKQARLRQGQAMVDEIERFLNQEPLHYGVTIDMLPRMA